MLSSCLQMNNKMPQQQQDALKQQLLLVTMSGITIRPP
jgi:hypothetical protein